MAIRQRHRHVIDRAVVAQGHKPVTHCVRLIRRPIDDFKLTVSDRQRQRLPGLRLEASEFIESMTSFCFVPVGVGKREYLDLR